MDFKNYVNHARQSIKPGEKPANDPTDPTETGSVEQVADVEVKSNDYYFNIVNPDTGRRYDIPMLSTADPDYYFRYVKAMRMKEKQPETFEKLINWS